MFERGDAVISAAGRDRNEFLAVAAADATGVFVCNGKDRPLDNPKRKNPKHLTPVGVRLEEEAFHSDKRLRKALAIVKANFLK
ncbi:MAG: KOW domain-containing protein [Clostridia bacterium]|nr:KOW domain-containing protein [Clostridia bacterium]